MNRFTKKFLVLISIFCSILFLNTHVWAISLSFSPSTAEINIGGSIDVDLIISGLENDDLGYFEFDINFDDSILGFNSYSLGNGLGNIAAGDADDWSAGDLGGGTINLIEISYLLDLSFQSDSFSLATLSFTGVGLGSSPLSYSNIVLGDDWGGALSADTIDGSIDVVPEPATLLLFGIGFIGLFCFKWTHNTLQ